MTEFDSEYVNCLVTDKTSFKQALQLTKEFKSPDSKVFFFRICFYTPKTCLNKYLLKETLKNDFETPSRLSPILVGSLHLSLYGSRLLMLLPPILRGFWAPISAYLSAPPAFSADGVDDFQSFLNCREHGKIAETIGREGGRCVGKHEMAGAIEGEKEWAR